MRLEVSTFHTRCSDKAQALKVLEESAEVYSAWQTLNIEYARANDNKPYFPAISLAFADELADTTKDETAKGPDMAKTHTTKDDNAITKQARYCEAMANRLAARVALHESTRAGNGWCYDVPREATYENIDRMITQLRLELLQLRELLDDAAPGNTTAASVPF